MTSPRATAGDVARLSDYKKSRREPEGAGRGEAAASIVRAEWPARGGSAVDLGSYRLDDSEPII